MSTPHVLVVEDDPSVRGLLQTLLAAEGYDVAVASDGLAGLVKASSRRPAVILLDLMMPDLGGVRVLEELRGDPALADVPVIVVTGKVDAVPAMQQILGEESVFAKPFGVAELLARVADVTGGPQPAACPSPPPASPSEGKPSVERPPAAPFPRRRRHHRRRAVGDPRRGGPDEEGPLRLASPRRSEVGCRHLREAVDPDSLVFRRRHRRARWASDHHRR